MPISKRLKRPTPFGEPKTLEESQRRAREDFYGLSEEQRIAAGGYWNPTGFVTESTNPLFQNRGMPSGPSQQAWIPYSPQRQGGVNVGGAPQYYGTTDFDAWENLYANQLMERVRSEFGNMGTLSSSAFAGAAVGAAAQAKMARTGMEQRESARRTQWELDRWAQLENQSRFGQSQQVEWAKLQLAQQEAQFQRRQYADSLASLPWKLNWEMAQSLQDAFGRIPAPAPQQGWIPGQEYQGPASSVSRIGGT